MNLYIVRHGIAMDREDWLSKDDSLRPLTDRGRERMTRIARGLAGLGVELDLVLSSPFVRARQTAEILIEGLEVSRSRLNFSEALVPTAHPSALLQEISEKYQVPNLALVGHEPHLSGLISFLLTGREDIVSIDFRKGGVCLLALQLAPSGWQAALEWLLRPRILTASG
jgi:phosphohistidine phosphatase